MQCCCAAEGCSCDGCSEPTGPTCMVLSAGVCNACKKHPPAAAVRTFVNSLRPVSLPAGGALTVKQLSSCGSGSSRPSAALRARVHR